VREKLTVGAGRSRKQGLRRAPQAFAMFATTNTSKQAFFPVRFTVCFAARGVASLAVPSFS